MLEKTITYKDFLGNERKETYYFNLTKTEITEMQLSKDGGLAKMLTKIVQDKNIPEIMKMFKDLIMKAYGEIDADGKHFRKSKEISEAFTQTLAYDEFFMELMSDPNKAFDFIKGILPADVAANIDVEKIKSSVENA